MILVLRAPHHPSSLTLQTPRHQPIVTPRVGQYPLSIPTQLPSSQVSSVETNAARFITGPAVLTMMISHRIIALHSEPEKKLKVPVTERQGTVRNPRRSLSE